MKTDFKVRRQRRNDPVTRGESFLIGMIVGGVCAIVLIAVLPV